MVYLGYFVSNLHSHFFEEVFVVFLNYLRALAENDVSPENWAVHLQHSCVQPDKYF